MFTATMTLLILFFSLAYISKIKDEQMLSSMPKPIENYTMPEDVVGFDLENQPVLTYNEDAEIDVIIFKDYKCTYCKMWQDTVYPEVYENLIKPGLVNFYFVNFSLHENPHIGIDSLLSAVAGRAIYKQSNDAFWEFNDLIFAEQGPMSEIWATRSLILKLVEDNLSDDIDIEQFKKDLDDPSLVNEVYKNLKIGEREGVTGTPTVFIGNENMENNDFASIMNKVEELMSKD